MADIADLQLAVQAGSLAQLAADCANMAEISTLLLLTVVVDDVAISLNGEDIEREV